MSFYQISYNLLESENSYKLLNKKCFRHESFSVSLKDLSLVKNAKKSFKLRLKMIELMKKVASGYTEESE